MSDLQKILSANKPMTLAGAPAGFLPWLAADLARAARGRAVFIAPDEAAMRSIVDAAHYFAPKLETLSFPAWEIGRASCRERVCQYVSISVVAVSFKKKTLQTVQINRLSK